MTSLRLKDASRTQFLRAQKLHRREQRTRHEQMIVEGPQAVREILTYGYELVRDVYVTANALERHADIRDLAIEHQVWTHIIDEDTMRDLSSDSQGLAVIADMPEIPTVDDALRNAHLVVATLGINDPGNVGTILRTADAAGADAVIFGKGSAELYAPKVIRAAAGSHFHVPTLTGLSMGELIESGHKAGLQVLVADGAGDWDLNVLLSNAKLGAPGGGPDLTRPVMWVMGNEAHGFAGVDLSGVDGVVSIPLYGKAESLNVAIATSVCVYATAMSQR